MTLDYFVAVVTAATFAVAGAAFVVEIISMFFNWREKERALTPVFVGGDIAQHDEYTAVRLTFAGRGRYIMIESISAPGFEVAVSDPRRPDVHLMIPRDKFAPYLNTSLQMLPGEKADLLFCIRPNKADHVVLQLKIAERFRRVKCVISKTPKGHDIKLI